MFDTVLFSELAKFIAGERSWIISNKFLRQYMVCKDHAMPLIVLTYVVDVIT